MLFGELAAQKTKTWQFSNPLWNAEFEAAEFISQAQLKQRGFRMSTNLLVVKSSDEPGSLKFISDGRYQHAEYNSRDLI